MAAPGGRSGEEPGLISGHANLALGTVNETIGNITGSEAWKSSGAETKSAGIAEMKEVGQKRDQDSAQHGLGTVEKLAGQAVGCEGMEKEGAESTKSS